MLRQPADSAKSRLPAAFLPWREGAGEWRRVRARGLRAAPFTIFYIAASWALFLPAAERTRGNYSIDQDRVGAYLFHIPDLSENFPRALRSLATGPWLNHNGVQLVYVTLLLLLFGLAFEAHEGTLTTVLVFFGTSFAAAVGAGVLLHLIYPELIDNGFLAHAWSRTWSGGSAGCFGLMGALAARARKPWLLLGLFVAWEVNIVLWYLHEYTPAFHLTALTTGFVTMRYAVPRGGQIWRRVLAGDRAAFPL